MRFYPDSHGRVNGKQKLMINDRNRPIRFSTGGCFAMLLRPDERIQACLATSNVNGDYLSERVAAQVGGWG